MIERFRNIFRIINRTEKLADQSGYPIEYFKTLNEVVSGRIQRIKRGEISGGQLLVIPGDDREMLVIPNKNTTNPDFRKALDKYKYGEGEESDKGFEELQRFAATEQENTDPDG